MPLASSSTTDFPASSPPSSPSFTTQRTTTTPTLAPESPASTFPFVHDRNVVIVNSPSRSTPSSSPQRGMSSTGFYSASKGSAFSSYSSSRGSPSHSSFSSPTKKTMNVEAEVASAVGAIDLDQEKPDSASGNPDNSSESTNSKTNTPRKPLTPSLSASSSETVSDCSDRLSLDSQAQSDATLTTANENQRKASTVSLDLVVSPEVDVYSGRKNISWFIILEDMGQGAYGQVKLAQYKPPRLEVGEALKVVLKYVIKKRILVDTWIRDRKIGTLPLEIHVLKYLQSYPHKNVVDMLDYFEDESNYYIEMAPHGIPGMDLFDYIELRTEMDEDECRSIFFQVASAIYHLHKVGVVHRDIKDENIILDGDGNIKLIDFGSAAYIKNGPFSVFVGTIDYAAPEVLRGQLYSGMEQDVWAAGILLYTIIYKENPFYDGTEIMNAELRIPHVMSEESVALIKKMLSRNISERPTMEEVMNDPWLKGYQTASEENTSSSSETSTAPAS